MNILMMVLQFPPAHSGGAEMQCWKQARALAARGHEVTILTEWLVGSSRRREVKEGVVIRRLGFFLPATMVLRRIHRWLRQKTTGVAADRPDPFSADCLQCPLEMQQKKFRWMTPVEWLGHLSFILEAAVALRTGRGKPDVVYVHESHWLAGFGQWLGERAGASVFCKEACGVVLQWKGTGDVPGRSCWLRRRGRCRFIAITSHIRNELEKAGIAGRRILEIPNGVELPEEPARPEMWSGAVYAGNFSQGAIYKAFDVLLKAWGIACRAEPGMRLRLFGGGGVDRWKLVAEQEGCGKTVEFAGPSSHLQDEFRQSGFLVLPSRVEGLSNVLLEAMASGLPAVVSDIPGNATAIRDGVEGLVVPTGDAEALAAAMVKLYRSADLRKQMGGLARARAEEKFAIGRVAQRLEEACRKAMAEDLEGGSSLNFGG